MMIWRKFSVGAVLALAAMPSLLFARPQAPATHSRAESSILTSLQEHPARQDPAASFPIAIIEKTGSLPAKQGMRLIVNADPGNIRIFTDASSKFVSYSVRVEADARDPGAKQFVRDFKLAAWRTRQNIALHGTLPWKTFRGQFRVNYEIHIPRRFNVEVHTLRGKIELQDVDGQVDLFTEGGSITVGSVGGAEASSHSSRGSEESFAARLKTMGGHIAIGDVNGTLQATTEGGHITTGNIAGEAILHTGGGQIHTGRISGTATLDTGGGNITAWLDDTSGQQAAAGKDAGDAAKNARKFHGASQFVSSEGDVTLYLPQKMAATIDAVIERGARHRIVSAPSLLQNVSCQDSGAARIMMQCSGDLNGGGEVVHLKALSGNIFLKTDQPQTQAGAAFPSTWMEAANGAAVFEPLESNDPGDDYDAAGFFAEIRRKILESWWGGLPVDAAEMQRHLENAVAPVYPEVARKAGVEGDVVLRISVSGEGRVTALKVLDGPPILARAAVKAVKQWQYRALTINGQPTTVVTTIVVSFRLH